MYETGFVVVDGEALRTGDASDDDAAAAAPDPPPFLGGEAAMAVVDLDLLDLNPAN
jgi:hypothetical protein